MYNLYNYCVLKSKFKHSKIMTNIRLSFGYLSSSKLDKITYKLCNKFKFLPIFYVRLFNTYLNSNEYSKVKHSFEIDFLNYELVLRYLKKGSSEIYVWDFKTFKNR